MGIGIILATVLAFAFGTAAAWIPARRRMRERVRERLVEVAEQRMKEEILRRITAQTAESLIAEHAPKDSTDSTAADAEPTRRTIEHSGD